MEEPQRVASFDDAAAQLASLRANVRDQAARVRLLEKYLDTLQSPRWKRVVFRIDGWGPWYQVRPQPRWRPWRRWWTS